MRLPSFLQWCYAQLESVAESNSVEKQGHKQVHGAMLRRWHVHHVVRDGVGIEPVLVHAINQSQTGHDVERVGYRCQSHSAVSEDKVRLPARRVPSSNLMLAVRSLMGIEYTYRFPAHPLIVPGYER